MLFPVSGVEAPVWLPVLVAFIISTFTSMGGVTGAFILLPFQVSVLGFTSPAVSPTNLIFNITAIPSGVYRYLKEKRFVFPLLFAITMGTFPGTIIGVIIRAKYLPDPKNFKLFAGIVLVYIAYRLLKDIFGNSKPANNIPTADKPADFRVSNARFSLRRVSFSFGRQNYSVPTMPLSIFCFFVGIVGGIYGIGGGSIIAPVLIVQFGLPVFAIAGVTLADTFISSVNGVIFYTVLGPYFAPDGVATQPDWLLGASFGIGGFIGIYLGTRLQKFIPAKFIKAILAISVTFISIKYIISFFN
ncbi:MAG: TSUP family transporter [candidate division Zixibacteria bacterium]|nr:TSUP family transporter [candidate division Zixibacteria bacterium]